MVPRRGRARKPRGKPLARPGGGLDDATGAEAGAQPPRRDRSIEPYKHAIRVDPQQVQREPHTDRVHRTAALEHQRVVLGQRTGRKVREAAPARAAVACDEQREAAGQRPALERREAIRERHPARIARERENRRPGG